MTEIWQEFTPPKICFWHLMHKNMKEDFNCNDSIPKVIISKTTYMVPDKLDCIDLLQNYNLLRQKCCNLDCTKGEMLAIESENVQQRYVLRGCWVWILAHITTNYSTFCNNFLFFIWIKWQLPKVVKSTSPERQKNHYTL